MSFAPRFLSKEEAAHYLGVGSSTFDHEVKSGIWPQPLRRGKKGRQVTWDRTALDIAADRLSGLMKDAEREEEIQCTTLQASDPAARETNYLHLREFKALWHMQGCPYRNEARALMPSGIGPLTLNKLVERGLAEIGPCIEHPGEFGWAITTAGRNALK
jgi:predicted DNA-binding transcriptional regulator AlpA